MRKRLQFILFFLSICICLNSYAQFEKQLSEARRFYDKSMLFEAKNAYAGILAKDSMNRIANLEMAELLFFDIEDYDQAYVYMSRFLRTEKDTAPAFLYALAKCEHYRGDVNAAEKHYLEFEEKIKDKGRNEPFREEVSGHLKNIYYLRQNPDSKNTARAKVVNLGSGINTVYPEYVPVVNENENVLMFTSKRKNELNKSPGDDERYREDMYVAKKNGPHFDTPDILPTMNNETQQLKNSPRNESLISLSPDGKTLFLFKKGSIYSSEFKDGVWSEPKVLDEKIISEAYENHASVTADGKSIYFTSERKGGYGGLDIYRAEKNADGSWAKPVNLGESINTKGDEESPYITPDGSTLFFSSNGLVGYGAHDIFKCEIKDGKAGPAQNMGKPFNSVADDIFFYPHHDLQEGFLSSNRKGGVGDFDIYRFYYVDRPRFKPSNDVQPAAIAGQVAKLQELMYKDTSAAREILSELKSDPQVASVFFRLNDSVVSENPTELFSHLKKNSNNTFQIEVVRNCDTCIYRPSYVYEKTVSPADIAAHTISEKEKDKNTGTVKDPKDVKSSEPLGVLSPVYFGYAKYEIDDNAIRDLNSSINQLSKVPSAQIVIYGHADSRGSSELNKRLAMQRALKVKSYLLSKGISSKRVKTVISRGEEEPAVNCGDTCTEEQHQQNRRVEIRQAK